MSRVAPMRSPLGRLALAALSGALAVLAFAPFGVYPLAVVALTLWFGLLRGCDARGAFGLGWAFGIGLLGVGIFWIRISLNEFGNMTPALATGLTLVFIAAMALYYGLAGWMLRRLDRAAGGPPWVAPVLLLPPVWMLCEWLRGWLFTGFPWMILGNSQIDGPLAGLAPLLGVHGVSLAVALSAGLLWGGLSAAGVARLRLLAGLVALWVLAGALGQVSWSRPVGAPLRVTLIQANIEQSLKWDPDMLPATLDAYLALTRAHLDSDLIVWPETAVPEFLHEVRAPLLEPLAARAAAEGVEILLGIPILESSGRYFNGLLSLGSIEDRYFKRHLVPFGEYLPFERWLRPLIDWFDVPMSGFSRGAAARPLLRVGSHWVGASICYEDVFPDEIRQALPDAAYLVNASNDAWFGASLAPPQHLEFARMRALENARDLARATNTGISAIIDARGRVTARVPAFERGTVTGFVRPLSGATPFARFGSVAALTLAALMLVAGLWWARRAPRPESSGMR